MDIDIYIYSYIYIYMYTYLVGGFNHLEKFELVNGKDYPIYDMENKEMFETTNQYIYPHLNLSM